MNARHILNQAFIPLVALPLHDSRTPTSVGYFYYSYLGDNLCSMVNALAIGVLWLLVLWDDIRDWLGLGCKVYENLNEGFIVSLV